MPRTTSIPDDVLGVLTGAVEATGNRVVIIKQLARPSYVAVDKVLKAAGGTWNRSAKAHLFGAGVNAAAVIDQLCLTGSYSSARDDGWFPTSAPIADRLVALAGIEDGHHVLEPSAGEGALVEAVLRLKLAVRIYCIERDPRRLAVLSALALRVFEGPGPGAVDVLRAIDDFLAWPGAGRYDRVVMNPPFIGTEHLDHVRHAFAMLKPGGVLVSVLPAGVTFRQDAKHAAFRAWVEDVGEIHELPADAFVRSKGAAPTVTAVRSTSVRTVMIRLVRP